MDGKRRISIVIFLNCIQVVSGIEHRKSPPPTKVFDEVQVDGRCQASRQKTIETFVHWRLVFSWIKPRCNQVYNKDPYLSIPAKRYPNTRRLLNYNFD
jgi:tRNA(His) 5'-end guanylyltransferase